MDEISTGEYYRLQYSYFDGENIYRGGSNYELKVSRDFLLNEVKKIYELYKEREVRIEILKVKAVRLPLDIKPVHIQFTLTI